ncbi:MAG: TonB-dependent receptor [Bacteroides intestinalis]|nr:TonB-dependent receptor [Bacteroides intestinalis]
MKTHENRALFSKAVLKATTCLFLAAGASVSPAFAFPEMTETMGTEIVQQQTITITGVVKDKEGEPVIGANVLEKGTSNGVITNIDGEYTLKVKGPKSVLVISYIGYETQEFSVGANRKINATLQEDSKMIDEVVVISYGMQRKGDVTSAITSVKAEDFTIGKIGDAAELVKGKIAGLSIVKSSGDPTETSSIMLRGLTTVKGSVTPLVLVDGVEGSLTTVAPENIASIDVLKDASAAAIYGTRGANGVILITTKSGKRDSHASANYSGYVSFSNWTKKSDFMDTHDVLYGMTSFNYEGYDTDWLAAITRKAGYRQNHSLTLDGGSKNSTYSANVTYSDEQGIMRKSDNRNLKMQLDFTQYALNDWLKFNVNALVTRQTYTLNNNNYAYRQAIIRNPSSPIYNEDGSYNENLNLLYYYNPRGIQDEYIGDGRNRFYRLSGNITFEPIKGWQTNLMVSMKENVYTGESYTTSKHYSLVTQNDYNGSASKSESASRNDNIELTSKYDFNIDKHRVSALVGYSYLYNVYDGFGASNGNFPTEAYLYNNLGIGTLLTEEDRHAGMSSSKSDDKLIGFFGRVSYGYDNRYNALISVRREGSTRFGSNHRWGTFPSVSLGWTISNEEFMKDQTWLNNLKLRVGYGVTGVIPTTNYLSQYTYSYDSYGDIMNKEGDWIQTLKVAQNPNKDLKWETTKEYNFGLDWSLLNERLSGSVDYYVKTTSDLLYDYSVPVPPNLYSYTTANVGKMRNNGIEIMINAIPVRTRDFEWNTTLTLSHNKNKLLSLSNDLYETETFHEVGGLGEPITVATHCMEVGKSLGDFWGLKSVGVSKDGVVLVEVSDGKGGWTVKEFNTNLNVKENRQRLGSGLPKVYAGWANNFRYKSFDLSLQFTGQFGYKILNAQRCYYENNSVAYNRLKSAANYYSAINTDGTPYIDEATGKQKMVRLSNSMGQGFWSDHLEKGDFVKLTNITLGYELPLAGKIKKFINYARLYLSAENVFCITGYSGIDPEVSNNFMSPGIDYQDKYPTTRSFTVGMNLTF